MNNPNTSSPQRLSPVQRVELDKLEGEIALPARTPSPPMRTVPLSAEAAALLNKSMIEKAEAFREETLRAFDERRKAADKAYQTADTVTAQMVTQTERMAEDTARHIATINDMEKDLASVGSKYTNDAAGHE